MIPVSYSQYGRIAYGLTMATLAGISLFGYSIYLKAIWGRRDLQKRSIFMTSLCFSDLLVIFGHMFSMIVACFYTEWPFGNFGCQINAFFGMAPTLISISSVALIAIESYYNLCRPEKHGVNFGFYLAATWISGLLFGFLPILGFGSYSFESKLRVGCLLNLSDRGSGILNYNILIFLIWFLYPMYKIIKYYGKIKKETGDGFLQKFIPMQMMCSLTPYAVISFMTIFSGQSNTGLTIICNLCAKFFLTSNPYIYILNDRDLRIACCQVVFGGGKPKTSPVSVQEKEKST